MVMFGLGVAKIRCTVASATSGDMSASRLDIDRRDAWQYTQTWLQRRVSTTMCRLGPRLRWRRRSVITSYSIHYTKLYDIDVSAGQTSIRAQPVYGRMFQTPFSDRIRNEVGIATLAVGNIYEPDHVNSILIVITSYSIHYTKLYEHLGRFRPTSW